MVSRLRAVATTTCLGVALGALLYVLVGAIAMLSPHAATAPTNDNYFASGLLSSDVQASALFKHNIIVLALFFVPTLIAARHARDTGRQTLAGQRLLALAGVRCAKERTRSCTDYTLAFCLTMAGLATVGQAFIHGRNIAAWAASVQRPPAELWLTLVHGPMEFAALVLPVALLLRARKRENRLRLRSELLPVMVASVLVLLLAALIEAHIAPGLVAHTITGSNGDMF
jgi:uncharacterized membrane protein SpoIIM required for sporulation